MIQLRDNNPYAAGYILPNYQRLYRYNLVYQKSAEDKFHIVVDGETLDSIAFKYYKDSKLWWIIYDINLELIFEPFTLIKGITLIIPYLPKLTASQL